MAKPGPWNGPPSRVGAPQRGRPAEGGHIGPPLHWILAIIVVFGCAAPPASEPPAPTAGSALLDEIGRAYWQLELEQILYQMWQGIPTTRLPDLTLEEAQGWSGRARKLLERLDGVDPEELSHAEWIALETLRWDLGIYSEAADHYWLVIPVTPYLMAELGVHTLFQSMAVESADDAERYLDLARQYPAFVDAIRAKLEAQRSRGIVLPVAELDLIVPTWKALAVAPETVFAAAARPVTASFGETLGELLDAEIGPAWGRLIAFLDGAYRDAAPETVGLGQYPGGEAYYQLVVRWYVSMEASPEEIHRLGLERIEATNARMAEVRRRLGFEGARADFHRSLRSDPRFFARTPEEVGERLLAYAARIEPKLGDYFHRLPRVPYGVERLGPDLEATTTYGYFQPVTDDAPRGVYYFNGSRLDQRSLISAQSLVHHELIPGHHFETAQTWENRDLPDYRRGAWHGGYAEGWGEYASSILAADMGLYDDPYDLYGRLSDDNFYAARLVVDTGMNVLGWSRRQAADLMFENTLESKVQIETETLRYAADTPAQALSYALGSLKILELRERAREALGERFDVRRFHDAVLGNGSMPLAVLEKHVDWFIEQESK